MDLCECGHVRRAHEADADFDGERWRGYWLECKVEECGCAKFDDHES